MKKVLLIVFLILFFYSCKTTTKYRTIPLSKPPDFYLPLSTVSNEKELLQEYQKSVIKLSEWQMWYNVQVGSNFYNYRNIPTND